MKTFIKANLSLCVSVLAICIAAAVLIKSFTKPHIAYIRSKDLVYGYFAMKDAHQNFENKSKMWKMNLDTLQKDYSGALEQFKAVQASLPAAEKEKEAKVLMKQEQDMVAYSQAVNKKAQQEDEKITQGVLNQVNSFVEDYGKSKGYEVILGTTLSGSVLYGDKAIDITDEVLEALNRNYKGEGVKHD
jgi:outer membrane protein